MKSYTDQFRLRHEGTKYVINIIRDEDEDEDAYPAMTIMDGTEKYEVGPSLKIPGVVVTYRLFECPKCLKLHKFPTKHGVGLSCDCGACWSFWGAGGVCPEWETVAEMWTIIGRQMPVFDIEEKMELSDLESETKSLGLLDVGLIFLFLLVTVLMMVRMFWLWGL